jgi:ABC-type sugar transport system ATPase subunit
LGNLDPFSNAGVLSVAQRQLIEIARSFMRGADIIVMDEPTAPLTDKEIEQLYGIIRRFTAGGGSVILITHKINEVFEIADKVTVLRDGTNVIEKAIRDVTQQELINAMVGREVKQVYEMAPRAMEKAMLEVCNLSNDVVRNISFDIKSGEVMALYGLMGAGCEDITASIYGVRACNYDSIKLDGNAIHPRNPSESLACGIAYVPSERKTKGLMLGMNITKNIRFLR